MVVVWWYIPMVCKLFFEHPRLHLNVIVVGTNIVVTNGCRVTGHSNGAQAFFEHPRLHLNAIVIGARGSLTNGCRAVGHSNGAQAFF